MADAKATFRLEGEDGTGPAFRSALGNVSEFAEHASRLLKGAFAVEAVKGIAEIAISAAEFGDAIAKGAVRAGVAVQTFGELAAAFKQSDVEIQSLSKGLKNMEVAVSKAAAGVKN